MDKENTDKIFDDMFDENVKIPQVGVAVYNSPVEVNNSLIEEANNSLIDSPTNTVGNDKILKNPEDYELDPVEKNAYPVLLSNSIPPDFKSLYDRVLEQYKQLPNINYNEIYKELSILSVKSCPTPSLSVLNAELERVQSAKDRLCQIYIDALKVYSLKKRVVDILKDSWTKFSDASSADKRKSESVFISSEFELDFAKVDGLLNACKHIIKNMDSLHENLSRRITIIQLQLKIFDTGRSATPDFTFNDVSTMNLSKMVDDLSGNGDEKTEVETI